MSGDEQIVLIASAGVAVWAWYGWYIPAIIVERLGAPRPGRRLILLPPVVCAAVLFLVLKTVSAHDVRDDLRYLGLYLVVGAGWLGVAAKGLPFAGLSERDDVVERGNGAAAVAVAGALVAVTLCFAGGNIGDGPGWWVVIFAAALATGTLAILWLLLDRLTGLSDTVTIDRDPAAGIRIAGLLVGGGLILGRAVAGDWVSIEATVHDFARAGWPVLVLFAAAALVERWARPTPERPLPSIITLGALPAVVYVAAAAAYVARLRPVW